MKTCEICRKKHYVRGLCRQHYEYWKYHNPEEYNKVKNRYEYQSPMCEVEGCTNKPKARNLCAKHLAKFESGKPFEIEPLPDIEGEVWKDIPDMPYEASSFGRIRRKAGTRGNQYARDLSICNRGGVLCTAIFANGKRKSVGVHRLVAYAFLGKNEDLEVNHIDGDKCNNKPENLEYCTRSENMLHAYRTGLIKKKLYEEDILQIKKMLERGVSQTKIAARYGVSQGHISKINAGTRYDWVDK